MRPLIALALLALFMAAPAPLLAQETRPLPEDYQPPAADLSQMDWLVGQWRGEGIGGHLTMESWLPATGDTMVGTFVQTTAEGGIQFTEHMYLMEHEGSLVLRLKHFNADLTGWEAQDDMTSFRLVELEPCAAWFGGLTIRCDGEDRLLIAVRMRNAAGETSELVFNFERAEADLQGGMACPDAETTADMNYCYSLLSQAAEERRARYFDAVTARFADNPTLVERLTEAETTFLLYSDGECGAIYERWSSGTIRDVMTYTCRIEMADRRTHQLWSNWLTFADSTPPLLPEPQPTL